MEIFEKKKKISLYIIIVLRIHYRGPILFSADTTHQLLIQTVILIRQQFQKKYPLNSVQYKWGFSL